MRKFISSIWYILLLVLLLLVVFSFHPDIMPVKEDLADGTRGTVFSKYIILLFAVLWIMKFKITSWLQSRFIKINVLMLMLISVMLLLANTLFGSSLFDIRAIAIATVAVMIGWSSDLSQNQLKFLLLGLSISCIVVCLIIILSSGFGFTIQIQYFAEQKNSLGVIVATSITILFYFFLTESNGFLRLLCLGLCLLSLACILTIRARFDTVISVLLIIYVFSKNIKEKKNIVAICVIILIACVVLISLPASIKDYVMDSIIMGYEDDITSGRSERNQQAIAFLSNNLFLGNLNANVYIKQIHNFPLITLYKYGLIFGFPILLCYVYIFLYTIIQSVKSDVKDLYLIGYTTLLIPFIASLGEPTFPFGPGTATIFNFIFFGIALRRTYELKKAGLN